MKIKTSWGGLATLVRWVIIATQVGKVRLAFHQISHAVQCDMADMWINVLIPAVVLAAAIAIVRFAAREPTGTSLAVGVVLAGMAALVTLMLTETWPFTVVAQTPSSQNPPPSPPVVPPTPVGQLPTNVAPVELATMPPGDELMVYAGSRWSDSLNPFLQKHPELLKDEHLLRKAISWAVINHNIKALERLLADHPELKAYLVPLDPYNDADTLVPIIQLARNIGDKEIELLLRNAAEPLSPEGSATWLDFMSLLEAGDVQGVTDIVNSSQNLDQLRDWNEDSVLHAALNRRALWTRKAIGPIVAALLNKYPRLAGVPNRAGETAADLVETWRGEMSDDQVDAILQLLSHSTPEDLPDTNDATADCCPPHHASDLATTIQDLQRS